MQIGQFCAADDWAVLAVILVVALPAQWRSHLRGRQNSLRVAGLSGAAAHPWLLRPAESCWHKIVNRFGAAARHGQVQPAGQRVGEAAKVAPLSACGHGQDRYADLESTSTAWIRRCRSRGVKLQQGNAHPGGPPPFGTHARPARLTEACQQARPIR